MTEIALGVAVLFAAGLLLRSFREMQTIDPGFAVDQTLSARLQLTPGSYPDAASIRLMADQLEERLAARPGVRAVGIGSVVPLSGLVEDVSFGVEGALPEPGRAPLADHWRATPGFFESLRIPLISGRYLQATDREGSVPVVVVSRSLAERHFPGVDPIGRRIKVGGVNDPEAPWWTVVGVVETLRTRGIAQAPEAEVFQAFDQRPARGLSVIVHTEADPIGFVDELRETIWSLDPNMPISQVTTLDSMFTASMAPERFVSLLLGVFAALALALGVVGIYGVMAYIVERQTREIGIRLALGAQPQRLLGSVLRRGFLLTGLGVALGLAGALSAGRALSNLLFRVSPSDPVTLATVVGLLALAALVACYWPARKATRVDPIITLRAE